MTIWKRRLGALAILGLLVAMAACGGLDSITGADDGDSDSDSEDTENPGG